jgi:uncharacterized membrane protein
MSKPNFRNVLAELRTVIDEVDLRSGDKLDVFLPKTPIIGLGFLQSVKKYHQFTGVIH